MDEELVKQIIELIKKHENMEAEKLLENALSQDPENIDLLFRLAVLNFYAPIVDYPSCYILFEEIISISKKHESIARLFLSCIKDREFGVLEKRTMFWFYEGKDPNQINPLIQQLIKQINNKGVLIEKPAEEIKVFLQKELNCFPNNVEILLLSAIAESKEKPVKLFERIIAISKENVAKAMIFFAYIRTYSYIDELLLARLEGLHTDNPEINSMIKYAISWFYDQEGDQVMEEKYLLESINLYQGHALNYKCLARLYQKQGREVEANELRQKAGSNVKKIYDGENWDTTDINMFFDELVKGIIE